MRENKLAAGLRGLDVARRLGADQEKNVRIGAWSDGPSVIKAASIVGVGKTTLAELRVIERKHPALIARARAGEFSSIRDMLVAGGYHLNDIPLRANYGRGDRWDHAILPLERYLRVWKNREYSFGHLAPREARKRLARIERLTRELEALRAALEPRSHKAHRRLD